MKLFIHKLKEKLIYDKTVFYINLETHYVNKFPYIILKWRYILSRRRFICYHWKEN